MIFYLHVDNLQVGDVILLEDSQLIIQEMPYDDTIIVYWRNTHNTTGFAWNTFSVETLKDFIKTPIPLINRPLDDLKEI